MADIQSLSDEELLALRPRGIAELTDDELVAASRGVSVPVSTMERKADITPSIGRGASAATGFGDIVAFGGLDEATGFTNAAIRKLWNRDPRPFKDLLQEQTGLARKYMGEAERQNPGSYLAGQVGGGLASALVPGGVVARGASLAGRGARAALGGAAAGGAYGFGSAEGDIAERLPGAGVGAATGAVLGPVAAGVGQAAGAAGRKLLGGATKAAPTLPQLEAAGKRSYALASQAGVKLHPWSTTRAFDEMARKMNQGQFREYLHPKAAGVLQEVLSHRGKSMDLDEIDDLRKLVKTVAASADRDERRIGKIMTGQIDEFLERLRPADVVAGNAKEGLENLTKARQYWTRLRKGETIEKMHERALNAVGANYTKAGMQTALRQQYRSLLNNEKRLRQFNPTKDELAAMKSIVRGEFTENALRQIARFTPTSMGSPLWLALYPITGPAKAAATRIAERKTRALSEAVRSGRRPSQYRYPLANVGAFGLGPAQAGTVMGQYPDLSQPIDPAGVLRRPMP